MPQILYWSQTERLSWSLRLHTTQPGPPRSVVGLATVGLLPPRAGHPFPITALRLLLKPKSGRKRHGRKARWRRLRLPSAVAFVLTLLPFRTVKCVLEGSASLSHALVGSLYININIPRLVPTIRLLFEIAVYWLHPGYTSPSGSWAAWWR